MNLKTLNLNFFFAKWSRTIHRWVGLYFAAIVLIYVGESLILPAIFSEGLPSFDGKPPNHTALTSSQTRLSLEQASQTFFAQRPKGLTTLAEVDAISYLPSNGLYRFENSDRYFEWYTDAENGKLLKFGFKNEVFLEDKGIFGWFSPVIHNIVEAPMFLLLVSLAISGIYLFISPFLIKKEREASISHEKTA